MVHLSVAIGQFFAIIAFSATVAMAELFGKAAVLMLMAVALVVGVRMGVHHRRRRR